MKLRLLFFSILITSFSFSQKGYIDSLKTVIQHSSNDSISLKALKAWEDAIYISDPDLDFKLCKQIEYLCIKNLKKNELSDKEKYFYNKKYATILYCMGNIYNNKGNYPAAIECHNHSLEIFESIDNKSGMAAALNNLGLVYHAQGNNSKAIDIYTKSLKISEDLNDKMVVGALLNNLGVLYHSMGNNSKALECQMRSLAIQQVIKDTLGISVSLSSIGNLYQDKHEYLKAIDFYNRSLKISQSLKDKLDEASDYNNLATAYNLTGNKTKALDCYTLGLQIDEEIGDKEGIALLLNNIGEYYTTQKDVKTAIDYFERSLKISKEIGKVLQIQDASQNLYQAFKLTHRDREALAMHELFIQMRDSINSETSKKEIIRQEFKYEYEKKEEAVRVRAMEEKKVVDAHFAQEKTQRYVLYSGGLLLLVFGSFMFKRFRVTQKQKIIIEKQKDLVEEKQKEVLDSIHYAGRIQKSLLPTERYIDKNLKRLIR